MIQRGLPRLAIYRRVFDKMASYGFLFEEPQMTATGGVQGRPRWRFEMAWDAGCDFIKYQFRRPNKAWRACRNACGVSRTRRDSLRRAAPLGALGAARQRQGCLADQLGDHRAVRLSDLQSNPAIPYRSHRISGIFRRAGRVGGDLFLAHCIEPLHFGGAFCGSKQ